jgi:hypothetical protein
MDTYINEVIKNVKKVVERLFSELNNIKIGIVSHSDYDYNNPCDIQDISSDK